MLSKRNVFKDVIGTGIFCAFLYTPHSHAGLNQFTDLDQFQGWLIERKFDSENKMIYCRASMPKYGPWFGLRVRLDSEDQLLIPNYLAIKENTFNKQLISRLRKALKNCRENFIYTRA